MIYLLYDIYMIDCSIYSLPPHRRCACHSLNLVATTDVEKIKDRHFDNLLKSCVSKVSNFNFLVGGILLANCCSFFRSEVFGIIKAEVPRRQTLFVTNWVDCLLFPATPVGTHFGHAFYHFLLFFSHFVSHLDIQV